MVGEFVLSSIAPVVAVPRQDFGLDLLCTLLHRQKGVLFSGMSLGIQVKSASTTVGWGPQTNGFSLGPLIAKAVTLQGSFCHTWPAGESVVSMLASGQLQLDSILSRGAHLRDWRSCFDAMHSVEIVKAVLRSC